jgi:hypothetical protein
MKYETIKYVQVSDLDDFIEETYKRPFSFQQQFGCRARGTQYVKVPVKDVEEGYVLEGYVLEDIIKNEYGSVSLKDWLERDPTEQLSESDSAWTLEMFWERNFFPNIEILFDDLFKKGLIEAGEYVINIDW